jgi:hypothetical protein
MMITDGQLLSEGWGLGTAWTAGFGVYLGTGTAPTLAGLTSTAALFISSNQRLYNLANINTYIKTTLAKTLLVDTTFSNITDVMQPGGKIVVNFALATANPTVAVSGTPTWGIAMRPTDTYPADAAVFSTSGVTHIGRIYLFSVGANGSGADVTISGDGTLTAGQVFRMPNLVIPISNLIA